MSIKKIISVGFQFPSEEIESISFFSDQSLLDYDIIIFEPTLGDDHYSHEKFNGKPRLTETGSFQVNQASVHWKSEIKTAFEEGKTIFIFLSQPEEVFIYTEVKNYSGTGRNRQSTTEVYLFNSYSSLPSVVGFNTASVIRKRGSSIKATADLTILTGYWQDFSDNSPYEVYIDSVLPKVTLTTKVGNKVVGATVYGVKGTIFLLPPIRYDENTFIEYDGDNDKEVWTEEANKFGRRLISSLVGIDKSLRESRESTPPPEWAQDARYRLSNEYTLESRILDITNTIEELTTQRTSLHQELRQEGTLRRLLYETGRELENAILDALSLLGFVADPFEDAESEFDAVFTSPEGRFLGEAEGKNNSAISIDKLSQLERNLQEDYQREEVTEYAKGVLFGNAYRLMNPQEREEFFTTKCLSGARRSVVALIRTPNLFTVAQYLKQNPNPAFAQRCREAIVQTAGAVVQFPTPPSET